MVLQNIGLKRIGSGKLRSVRDRSESTGEVVWKTQNPTVSVLFFMAHPLSSAQKIATYPHSDSNYYQYFIRAPLTRTIRLMFCFTVRLPCRKINLELILNKSDKP